jgi:hypothetical protein
MKKMKKLNLLLGTLIATAALSHAVDSYSDVVGYLKSSFPSGTSGQAAAFVKPDVYTGSASKSTASSFSVTGLALANNSLAPSGGLPTHYLEITSGTLEGYLIDILSNSGTTVQVNGTLPAISGSVSVSIRPHVKVSDIFKGNTSLADYTDTVMVYNSDGSTVSLLRDSSSTTGWVDANTFSAADFVVYPSQAFLLNTSGSGTFTFSGTVKKTATLVPLYASSVNFVSVSNPSTNPSLQNSNLGTNLADYVDTVGTFSTDGNFSQNGTYLWAGATDKFIDPNTFSTVSGVNLPGAQAILVGVSSDTTWKLAAPYTP